MAIRSAVPFKADGDTRRCPTCGYPVRIVYRDGKVADHYEPIVDKAGYNNLPPMDEETAKVLKDARSGKKTVALVGMAPTSCSLAPYDDEDVEIWGLNEAASFQWMKRWTRWFQLHKSDDFMRDLNPHRMHERGYVRGHYDWLKTQHNKPIYMQFVYSEIPDSKELPLVELYSTLLPGLRRGNEKSVKYFTSTFAYMMALAIYEMFERIELYGFEMSGGDEFVPQKACAEFWIGYALGRGIEVVLPEGSQLAWGPLYGFQGQGSANTA